MKTFEIYNAGILVCILTAPAAFVASYCQLTGAVAKEYTGISTVSSEPTTEDILDVLLGVKTNEQTANG